MRLLFVIDNLGPGGAQRQMTALAVELARRGHTVELFAYYPQDHFAPLLRAAGIPIHLSIKPRKASTATVRALRRVLRGGEYDLVLSFMTVPNLYAILACCGLSRRPRLVVAERAFPHRGWLGLRDRLVERLYPRADRVVTNSHHMRQACEARRNWARGRVTTIWNGLDLTEFSPQPLALARPPLTLLAVGRQSPHKNWRRIVEALAIARDRHGVVARVDMLGPCENLWGREAEYCRAVRDDLRRLDLEASWSWLGKRGDVPAHLAAHHALVHPSHSEGLPNVVCEALACGRPVLVSRVLDHPRLVQEGETGFLFDPARPEELAEAIARLARLPDDELLRMGRAARAFAEQNLSLARMADDYERLFGEVLTCGAGRVDQP